MSPLGPTLSCWTPSSPSSRLSKKPPRTVARVQRARDISLSKLPVRKRPRSQSVMFRHRYALRHEKISTRQSPLSGAWSEIGEYPWVMRIVHRVQILYYIIPFVKLYIHKRGYTSSPTLARQLQLSVPCNQVNRGVDADKIYFQPQCLHVLPSCVTETPRSILGAIQKGQWLTSLDLKDPYFHIVIHPANRNSLRFCKTAQHGNSQFLSYDLLISPRVFTKILKPVLVCAKNTHLHGVKLRICNWTTQIIIIIELVYNNNNNNFCRNRRSY